MVIVNGCKYGDDHSYTLTVINDSDLDMLTVTGSVFALGRDLSFIKVIIIDVSISATIL